MADGYRYRREGETYCVDLRLRRIEQLFDGRDPAPFRERDLDPHAAEYVTEAFEDLPRGTPVKMVVDVGEPLPEGIPSSAVGDAIRAYFEFEELRLTRELRRHVRQAQFALGMGLGILVVFLSIAEVVTAGGVGHARQVVREGLVITGWVAMWRPLEALLYDWWPLFSLRRVKRRIREAPVEVREPT
ncbi:MAG: hypothetical protein JNM74_03960 [Myxococcales bacterium]|nr:hypothetical protein [Myxococcales bacterium]